MQRAIPLLLADRALTAAKLLSEELEEAYQRYLRDDKLNPYYTNFSEFDFTNMLMVNLSTDKVYSLARRI